MGLIVAMLAALLALGAGIALGANEEQQAPGVTDLSKLRSAPEPEPGVELKARRTATSETFRLGNGRLLTRIHQAPINYRNAEGDWKPIENALRLGADGTARNGANAFDVKLPERIGSEPLVFSTPDHWVSAQLLGHSSSEVDLMGSAARYGTDRPGTDFKFTAFPNGLKEEIEVASLSEPSSFEFELQGSPGLTPELTTERAIEFRDGAGEPVVSLPTPVMYDSASGHPAVSGAVAYDLQPSGKEGWRLTVTADREWLAEEGRSWPVTIDPTIRIESPALDCTFGGFEDSPKDEDWSLCASAGQKFLYGAYRRTAKAKDEWTRSLLRFDLSKIPSNAYVTGATMGLHAPQEVLNTSGLEIRRTTRTWNNLVKWTKYNGYNLWTTPGGDITTTGAEVLTSQRGAQAGWWNFSEGLLPLVAGWVKGSTANQGVLLKLRDDKAPECETVPPGVLQCKERSATLESSAAPDTSKRPYLDVVYYPAAPKDSKVTSPPQGTVTARRLKLKAGWKAAGVTGVTFQFRSGSDKSFETIPTSLVHDSAGKEASWPVAVTGKQESPAYYFDAAHASSQLQARGGDLEVRALFEGPIEVAGYSQPIKATVDRRVGGPRDATTQVGPGAVDLLTGNFSTSRTDVAISGFGSALEFGRTHSSRDLGVSPGEEGEIKAGDLTVLGRGWKPSVTVEAAGGSAWRSVREFGAQTVEEEGEKFEIPGYALLTDIEGYEYAFELEGNTYKSPPEASGLVLFREGGALILTDVDGNRTRFESSGGASEYLPISVSQTGGKDNKTQMIYEIVGGNRRLKMMIAPTAAGVTCNEGNATTTLGCRALTFSYQPATKWGASSAYKDRLSSITYWGPATSSSMGQWQVAEYAYDSKGRLAAAWDPRISSPLEEQYAYTTEGQLQTITPPGEEPWTLEYGTHDGEDANGRLVAIKRASLVASPAVAQTMIVYGVPLSAPYDMSPATIAKWGQEDLPVDATAIFPPDQVPGTPPSSYSRAVVYYMDTEGHTVNTATPSGAGTSAPSITTTEVDEYGNVTRELSAQNRLRALAKGSESVVRSEELDTHRTFNADGTELLEEWGPLHEVSGSAEQARKHTTIQYDGKEVPTPPVGTPMPHLPIRVTVGASIPGQGTDADVRVTETKYDWTLRKPTETIVDPLGLALRTQVAYDKDSGLPTERRMPESKAGGDAGTTKLLYYTAGAHPTDSYCGNKPAWANLPCKTLPAAQPGTAGLPQLVVTKYAIYNQLGQPLSIQESPGGGEGGTRTRSMIYDSAGRPTSSGVTGTGINLPKVETLYKSTTGRPVIQRFQQQCGDGGCTPTDLQELTMTYDTLGRPAEYLDADGNLSKTTYDLLGRPATTNDGKGTQNFTYDATSGLWSNSKTPLPVPSRLPMTPTGT